MVVDEFRRAIPAFVGLRANEETGQGGAVQQGEEGRGKRELGGDENCGFELETELQCRRR
jgi:hypothetical protein